MSDAYQSLAHSNRDCKYHVVFVPKRRQKAIFGNIRRQLGPVFHALAKQKECQIVEGHLMSDHVHMCIAIPPKHPVASVIGFLKGKSAIAIAKTAFSNRPPVPRKTGGLSAKGMLGKHAEVEPARAARPLQMPCLMVQGRRRTRPCGPGKTAVSAN